MKKVLGILAASLVLLSGTAVRAADRRATVYTIDGQKLVATISNESFGIRTDYGTLNVPTDDILAIYPGFRVGESTRKRIVTMIARLTTANKDAAVRDLTYIGRIAVPHLQAAAESDDKQLAKEAKAILKKIWPSGASVPRDGSGILRTRDMELRGTLTFLRVTLRGSFGRKVLLKAGIRLIRFSRGKVQPATDTPQFPPAKDPKEPAFEFLMKDNSRIIGTVDAYSVDVETPYGRLTVPVKQLVSVKLGDPDQFVTRAMSFLGKLSTTTLNIKSKVGTFRLDRDKVRVAKAVLDESATPVTTATTTGVLPNQWSEIFNRKDLTGWSRWGSGSKKVEDETIHLAGDAGLTYQDAGDVSNVIVAAEVRINKQTGQGAGVKLTLRDGPEGTYYIHFDGKNGAIFKWDNKTKQSISLKNFQAEMPDGNWHRIQFGILGSLMLAYVNGKSAADVRVDPNTALPPGKVSIGTWNCDANFRDIRVKILK